MSKRNNNKSSNKMFKRGLITGRFQPFHNGHLALVKQALPECDELVIVVGSAQFNFIEKDPFTAGERVFMIHEALAEEAQEGRRKEIPSSYSYSPPDSSSKIDLKRCYIIPTANDENNARWIANVRSQVPAFDVLYSGNSFVAYLARLQDPLLVVRAPKFAKKQEYNGSYIRRQIVRGRKWKHLVPNAVAKVIEDLNGIERMRTLAQSDSNPAKW